MIPTGALFLDDIRIPKDVYEYIKNDIYLSLDWDIVRTYNDFVQYITDTGLPDIISFGEKSRYECAKWLVQYCLENDLDLPFCYVHSKDIVEQDNINHLLKNYNDSRL